MSCWAITNFGLKKCSNALIGKCPIISALLSQSNYGSGMRIFSIVFAPIGARQIKSTEIAETGSHECIYYTEAFEPVLYALSAHFTNSQGSITPPMLHAKSFVILLFTFISISAQPYHAPVPHRKPPKTNINCRRFKAEGNGPMQLNIDQLNKRVDICPSPNENEDVHLNAWIILWTAPAI